MCHLIREDFAIASAPPRRGLASLVCPPAAVSRVIRGSAATRPVVGIINLPLQRIWPAVVGAVRRSRRTTACGRGRSRYVARRDGVGLQTRSLRRAGRQPGDGLRGNSLGRRYRRPDAAAHRHVAQRIAARQRSPVRSRQGAVLLEPPRRSADLRRRRRNLRLRGDPPRARAEALRAVNRQAELARRQFSMRMYLLLTLLVPTASALAWRCSYSGRPSLGRRDGMTRPTLAWTYVEPR